VGQTLGQKKIGSCIVCDDVCGSSGFKKLFFFSLSKDGLRVSENLYVMKCGCYYEACSQYCSGEAGVGDRCLVCSACMIRRLHSSVSAV